MESGKAREKHSSPLVLCVGGLISSRCGVKIEEPVLSLESLGGILSSIWGNDPNTLILVVSPTFEGLNALLASLEEEGWNHYLLEVTGVPESMMSGLSLDKLIDYYLGFMALTSEERLGAKPVRPTVTRRELLRRLFLIQPVYTMIPRMVSKCGERGVCPYGAISGEGEIEESKCRGCMLCTWKCPSSFNAPSWSSHPGLSYAYKMIYENQLDGILIVCRHHLEELGQRAVEASPARLLPYHVPCIAGLDARRLRVMASWNLYVHVYFSEEACRSCRRFKAVMEAIGEIKDNGITVSDNLTVASAHAYLGFSARRMSPSDAARMLGSEG
ncbi:MAG: hypothetical protein DSY37_04905 [Hyperthermus sp.]|nr:MAG: hypothetical protein DSY37_04905 [Hyperthermus sp.]